ncbi:MAG: DUF2508 family protein [Clostridiales bacterium]|nr:DUF2508 family protein [Clostridiales bacterium]
MIKKIFARSEKVSEMDDDNKRIIDMLYDVKKELDYVHQEFDNITDAILIDSFIYEIQALNMKYQYYIKLCKERGLIANGFESI